MMIYLVLTDTSVAQSNAALLISPQVKFFNITTNLAHLFHVVSVNIIDDIFSLIMLSWKFNDLFRERRSVTIPGFLCCPALF